MQDTSEGSIVVRKSIEDLTAKVAAHTPKPEPDPDARSVAVVVECLAICEDAATVALGRILISMTDKPDPMPDWQRPMRIRAAVARARLKRALRRRRGR